MGNIKDALKGLATTESLVIATKLDGLIKANRTVLEDRVGMHGSGIIASDSQFCYREQVLSFFYRGVEPDHSPNLERIFLEGWYVHKKWQDVFEKTGVSLAIEQRGHSCSLDLLFTPDAIIMLGDRKYVVEIKSMNTYAFKNATSHPSGQKQLQLYMHMLAIPYGFVLAEDKNDQRFKVFPEVYDALKAKPYVERMLAVQDYVADYQAHDLNDEYLPLRPCSQPNSKRAQDCRYCKACFYKKKRELLLKFEEEE